MIKCENKHFSHSIHESRGKCERIMTEKREAWEIQEPNFLCKKSGYTLQSRITWQHKQLWKVGKEET